MTSNTISPQPTAILRPSALMILRKIGFERLSQRHPDLILILLLCVFASLSLPPLIGDSCTFDEGTHIFSGYTALKQGDFWLFNTNPPLSKEFNCLPLLLMNPISPHATESESPYALAYRFLYQSGNDPNRILFWTRMGALFWGALLVASVYAMSNELYGPGGALVSGIVAAFCPTLLAHAHLATPDVPMSTVFFLSIVSFGKFLKTRLLRWAVATGALVGAALVIKHNSVILLPIFSILLLSEKIWTEKPPLSPDHSCSGGRARWMKSAFLWIALGLTSYFIIWATYRFRFQATTGPELRPEWVSGGIERPFFSRVIASLESYHLLPEAYLLGLREIDGLTLRGFPTFALGLHGDSGWWWYFPFVFLVKTPLCTLALMGWGCFALIRRMPREQSKEHFLIIPIIVYGGMVLGQSMNLGIRHLLCIHPFLFVLTGGLWDRAMPSGISSRPRSVLAVLLAGLMLGCLLEAPHFISFFNIPSRLLAERHEMLVDSNLDWGQDLGRLQKYVQSQGISNLKLGYFGAASPRHLGLSHQFLPGLHVYTDFEKEWEPAKELNPGDFVAVSLSNLVGFSMTDKDFYRKRLAHLEPCAKIGRSIWVYRIPTQASP